MKYIRQAKGRKCVFCKMLKEKRDKKNFIILRSSSCFAVLNTFPYNNGHTLVVTNRHVKFLEKLNNEELLDINLTLIKAKSLLEKALKPDGFNIGVNLGKVAGAGITGHLHFHIVPRWGGDTNFMPITSCTKIISQSLTELHESLKKI